MHYEMRTYTIQVGKVPVYLEHFEKVGLPIISKYAKLVGWWITEHGELNQVIHIWEYKSLDERAEKRKQLYEDREWLEKFLPVALPMVIKQESQLLKPASFSPIR